MNTSPTVTRGRSPALLALALAIADALPALLAAAPAILFSCFLFGPAVTLVFIAGLLLGLALGARLAIRASASPAVALAPSSIADGRA